MSKKNIWIAVLGGAVLLLIVLFAATRRPAVSTVAVSPPAVALATATVGTFVETVEVTGRVGAAVGTQSKLSFAIAGVLQSVYVHVGQHVAAGEPLAALDTRGLALSASQAQADIAVASANQRSAAVDRTSTKIAVDEAALRRAQALYAAGVAAHKDIEAAQAQIAADRADAAAFHAQAGAAGAQVASAQARAGLAQRDYSNGVLRAAADGVVLAIYKQVGEAVDPTVPVVAIGPGSTNSVTLDAFSSDAQRVKVGDSVDVRIVGTQLHGTGRVTSVVPSIDPATQSSTIVVSGLPSGAPGGSAVAATINVATDRGVLVPQSAIVQDPQTGRTLVFVQTKVQDGTTRFAQRVVRIARSNGAAALIASGLRPGERVATQGAFALLAPAGT
ncbi:MAG: efflux RND transporter periplasmic adaptor subunit [Candidatus Eremiobacteraeota bacterium]|nr:efflux RND transporter periplasmic adaptor subunit [Candidatus Eremiobacteraeota bacterium]